MSNRERIYAEIDAERARQDEKWGGPAFDDLQTGEDWTDYINRYSNDMHRDFRSRMLKTAALAVAALESLDRKAGRGT